MRFLCLHGKGTNSKILEMQTAAIRYDLGDYHTYDFVDGTVPWEIDYRIKNLVPGEQDTFTYFDWNSSESTLKAIHDLETFIKTDGPYDGVISFSQAGSLVSTWMMHQIDQGKSIESTFKCAIFLSTATPPINYQKLLDGKLEMITSEEAAEVIDIPTAHVWGKDDEWVDTAVDFSKMCKGDMKSVFIHDGGHEIPGSGDSDAVARSVNVIRRAIQLAEARSRA